MTEREHCVAVARDWLNNTRDYEDTDLLADLLERERAGLLERAEASEAREAEADDAVSEMRIACGQLRARAEKAEAAAGQMRAALEYTRPEVLAFARAMEAKLRENDWKGGWKGDSPVALIERVKEEAEELAEVIGWRGGFYSDVILREAADVANMAMMVADVCGGLPTPALATDAGRTGYQSPEQVAQACAAARNAALEDAAAAVDTLGNARWDEATGLEENGEDDEAEAYEEQGMALSQASVAIRALKEKP